MLTPYLKEAFFEPSAIEAMTTAFVDVCARLQLVKRDDAVTQAVARKVIDIGRMGERDPHRITELVLLEMEEACQRSA
jgi:hypothetical protein